MDSRENWLLTVGPDGRILDGNQAVRRELGDVSGRRCCDLIRLVDAQGNTNCNRTCSGGLVEGEPQRDSHGRVGRRRTGRVVCDAVGDMVVVSVLPTGPAPTITRPLSAREREILQLVAAGCTNPTIAERLEIRPATVRTHLEHIREKLGVSTRAEAVAQAMAKGEIQI